MFANIKSTIRTISFDEFWACPDLLTHNRATVYRGHGSTSWPLVSSIFRSSQGITLPISKRRTLLPIYFTDVLPQFLLRLSMLHPELNGITSDTIQEKMFVAQHYGLPTPGLDWSFSPLVAVFMAVHFMPTNVDKFRIFRADRNDFPSCLEFYEPKKNYFKRSKTQRGLVSYVWNNESHDTVSDESFSEAIEKYDTPVDAVDIYASQTEKTRIIKLLNRERFTADELFPDSTYWLASAYASEIRLKAYL